MHTSLSSFIGHARSKNMDHQTIRMLLLSAGWKEKDIASALASETLDMPVPSPLEGGSARDAFFHLLAFTTLYASVISLIILLFTYINKWLPDAAFYDPYAANSDASSIRWSIAIITVAFPLFLLISRALIRELTSDGQKLSSGVRRWLTYMTLFVTACALIGDLITLLFTLLNGELSLRFILKVGTVLLLAGLPFRYYFATLRMEHAEFAQSQIHRKYFWISCGITIASIFSGIVVVGSPLQGRAEKFDDLRVNDLRSISEEIFTQVYGQSRFAPVAPSVLPKPLPKTLESLSENVVYTKIQLTDRETGEPYVYKPKGTTFELCAVFSLARNLDYDIFWNHESGQQCFRFNALEPSPK